MKALEAEVRPVLYPSAGEGTVRSAMRPLDLCTVPIASWDRGSWSKYSPIRELQIKFSPKQCAGTQRDLRLAAGSFIAGVRPDQ